MVKIKEENYKFQEPDKFEILIDKLDQVLANLRKTNEYLARLSANKLLIDDEEEVRSWDQWFRW